MSEPDLTAPTHPLHNLQTTQRRPGRLRLRVQTLHGEVQQTLDGDHCVVGRSSLADLDLDDASLSGLHFELRPTARGAQLRDLHSTNGVWFEGRRAGQLELLVGDSFDAGSCRFTLLGVEEREVQELVRDRFGPLLGASEAMRELYAQLLTFGPTPATVLLLGETGTGKELVARTLHELSKRRGPLVVLNCGALTASLAESTLLGFCKGAFTGADEDRPGRFEAAAGGTLFIDEVGELPWELQPKLLRALQEGTVTRIGESHARPLDVRVIAATNRDLRRDVEQGRFREDLYYRLAAVDLHLPPLRERGADVLMLAEDFLRARCREHGYALSLGDEAREALRAHSWPGNVRELHNAIERAAHLRREGEIEAADLRLVEERGLREGLVERLVRSGMGYDALHEEVDRWLLPRVLEAHGGNYSHSSERLQLTRARLRARLKKLGLYPRE